MLRLYLDANEGVTSIPCALCGRPMLLAVQRMGRTLVDYRGSFRIRPGHRATLVCPEYECDYEEPVEIARSPLDAVAFSAVHAAGHYQMEHSHFGLTLEEHKAALDHLVALYQRTSNPKLPSAIQYWREGFSMAYWNVRDYLERSLSDDEEVSCELKEHRVQGKVKAIMPEAVVLNRSSDGEPVLIRVGEFRSVAFCMEWPQAKYDFDRGRRSLAGSSGPWHSPTWFVKYSGQALALDGVTKYGMCRVHTKDPNVARAVGLRFSLNGCFAGEFPGVLAEGSFRIIRYCWVGKYRMHVSGCSADPLVVQLETRNMEAAKELGMTRTAIHIIGQRQTLRWYGYFHRSEITDEEEYEIPVRMPRVARHR